MNIRNRLYLALMGIFFVVLFGSIGYYTITGGNHPFLNCIYMTVITLTGVGYGEIVPVTGNPFAEIFTIITIIFGMGVILYGISTLTAWIIEGELTGLLRKNKMLKRIGKLEGHHIVCGGGETGRPLIEELIKNQENVVLIESDMKKIEQCIEKSDLLYIHGDATDDGNLELAGIQKASGIIICLPSDKDNLYITMTARMLNSRLRIISRVTHQHIEPKLKKAGANRVVSPNVIGALRMASEMIRPTVVDFLDAMLRSKQGNLRIHQITISNQSTLIGKKISESGIKNRYGLLVLGAKKKDGELEFNPAPERVLQEGMALIVMGEVDRIVKARQAL